MFAAYTMFTCSLTELIARFFKEFCVFFYNSLHLDNTFPRTVWKKRTVDYTDLRGYLSIRSNGGTIETLKCIYVRSTSWMVFGLRQALLRLARACSIKKWSLGG